MPSTLLGFFSGGQALFSGFIFSGTISPYGQVLFRSAVSSSGSVYIGMLTGRASGGITITSGGGLSSGGMADGMELRPGGDWNIPALMCSGQIHKIFTTIPAAVSGFVRLFYEIR